MSHSRHTCSISLTKQQLFDLLRGPNVPPKRTVLDINCYLHRIQDNYISFPRRLILWKNKYCCEWILRGKLRHCMSTQHFFNWNLTRFCANLPSEASQWIAWTKWANCRLKLLPFRLLHTDAALLKEKWFTLLWQPAGTLCPTVNVWASLKMTHILHLAEDTAGERTTFWPAASPTCEWPPAQVREIILWARNGLNIGH